MVSVSAETSGAEERGGGRCSVKIFSFCSNPAGPSLFSRLKSAGPICELFRHLDQTTFQPGLFFMNVRCFPVNVFFGG